MSITTWRRSRWMSLPAITTLACFFAMILRHESARADDTDSVAPVGDGTGGLSSLALADPSPNSPEGLANIELSTGAAQTTYAFRLPRARGDAQPTLRLRYNSMQGPGVAGVGWAIDLPSIVRKGAAGIPRFADQALGSPTTLPTDFGTDDYYIDGRLLVPVAQLTSSGQVLHGTVLPGETFPQLPAGTNWTYFRTEIDDGARYFCNASTWLVQTKTGHMLHFGAPQDGLLNGFAISSREVADQRTASTLGLGSNDTYRWNLVRDVDASGNTVYYVWDLQQQLFSSVTHISGTRYLTDIYDTLAPGATPGPDAFAHHVHLTYTAAQYPGGVVPDGLAEAPYANSPIWRAVPAAELAFVDVTSATWSSTRRQLVRSYTLGYTSNSTETRSYLSSIQELGNCQTSNGPAVGPILESTAGLVRASADGSGVLGPNGSGCRALPPMTYQYFGISGPNDVPPVLTRSQAYLFKGSFTTHLGTRLLDINGDGAAELLFSNGNVVPHTTAGPSGHLSVDGLNAYNFGVASDWSPTTLSLTMFGRTATNVTLFGSFGNPDASGAIPFAAAVPSLRTADQQALDSLFALGNPPGRDVDIDGDGFPDATFVPSSFNPPTYITGFSTRDRGGITHPYHAFGQTALCVRGLAYDPQSFGSPGSNATRALADVDGDGLYDLIIANKFPGPDQNHGFMNFHYLPDRGDGRYGIVPPDPTPGACDASYGFAIFPVSFANGDRQSDPVGPAKMQDSVLRFGDLNGDGMADFAILDSTGLSICIRHGGAAENARWRCSTDSSFTFVNSSDIQIGDIDGSGLKQVVFVPNPTDNNTVTTATAINADPTFAIGPKDGLLRTVSNGAGASTQFVYSRAAGVPIPVWVANQVTTTNTVQAAGAVFIGKNYQFSNPIYDSRDRVFVGFAKVSEVRTGVSGAPGTVATTTFGTTSCLNSPDSCDIITGQVDYSIARASRGIPVVIETGESSGVAFGVTKRFSTIVNGYTLANNYTGMDSRQVRSRSLHQQHTYLWDETQAVATVAQVSPFENVSAFFPISVSLPATELRTRHELDAFDNEFASTDYGIVGVDQPILRTQAWNLPFNDTTGWNFRPGTVKTGYANAAGTAFAGPTREYDYSYSPRGQLTDTFAFLSGGLSLPGPASGRAAPQPPSMSQNGLLHLRHIDYDSFGSVHSVSTGLSANQTLRCTTIAPDALYAQLPATITRYPGGCNLGPALITSVQFDRGLEEPVSLLSPATQLTVRKYDDFGRLKEVDQPHASIPGLSDVAFDADYDDTPPVRRVHFQTVDGADTARFFVDHYLFKDGLGDTLERIDQAGTQASTQWIVSGMHTRYSGGPVKQVAKPFFVASSAFPGGSPGLVAHGALPITALSSAATSFSYDGLGRTLQSTDFDGQMSTRAYHSMMSVDYRDPEQAAGDHQGSLTNVLRDGHGRLVRTQQVVAHSSHGSGTLTTSATYQATGEPLTITQTFPGAPGSGIVRAMTYDSLGRLVLNQEPNSGTWTYAYNDVGEMVGTSDGRGCGENIFRDAIGRVVAEDYSPCSPSQPAYTAPDTTTGAGTEAFNLYDAPLGMLTASWDLGQHSIYGYDARGRLTSLQRQVVAPTAVGIPPSGAGLSIFGTIVDAQGNPLAGVTVTLSGSAQATTQTDADGRYVFGNLVAGRNYSVLPTAPPNCSLKASTVANLNGLTTSQTASFMGIGSGCGGNPQSTPIPPVGNIVISGVVTASDGNGVQGLEIDLNGAFQAVTHTDASGFYAFRGLGAGNYSLGPTGAPSGCSVSPGVVNNLHASTTQNFSAIGAGCFEGIPARGGGTGALDARYASHVFTRTFGYGAANRLTSATTGADVSQLVAQGSQVNIGYAAQGTLTSLSSSYGSLITSQQVDASGAPVSTVYGDKAGTNATFWYDNNELMLGSVLQRNIGGNQFGAWATYTQGGSPSASDFTLETVLSNAVVQYDRASNPRSITQSPNAGVNPNGASIPAMLVGEWPDGAKPVFSRTYSYGDDYRLEHAQTQYGTPSANDAFVSPYTSTELSSGAFPAQTPVSTHNRVRDQQFVYDFRGNITSSIDDAGVFFDRSLGGVLNGSAGGVSGPDQLGTATLVDAHAGAAYDVCGRLTQLTNSLTGAVYKYTWDELGRLATATRTDAGQSTPAVQEQLAYNAGGGRVLMTRTTAGSSGGIDHTVQVFDSLVLEHAAFPAAPGDYERDAKAEHVYLGSTSGRLAHVFYDDANKLPAAAGGNGRVHVFLTLGDRLGSTSFVIDRDSSELVERPSYLAYGAADSDFRPARWNAFREDYRFTGHWDDGAVGLAYFNARFYSPELGRFISPDPAAVVGAPAPGRAASPLGTSALSRGFNGSRTSPLSDGTGFADARLDNSNPYAYCNGNPVACADPSGLWAFFIGGLGQAEAGLGPVGGGVQGGAGFYYGSQGGGTYSTFGVQYPVIGASAGFGLQIGFTTSDTPAGTTIEGHASGGVGAYGSVGGAGGLSISDDGSKNLTIGGVFGVGLGASGGLGATTTEVHPFSSDDEEDYPVITITPAHYLNSADWEEWHRMVEADRCNCSIDPSTQMSDYGDVQSYGTPDLGSPTGATGTDLNYSTDYSVGYSSDYSSDGLNYSSGPDFSSDTSDFGSSSSGSSSGGFSSSSDDSGGF